MAGRSLCCLCLSAIVACAAVSLAQSTERDVAGTDPRHFEATAYGQPITLGPNWLFAPGDNATWASPTFDDIGWKTVSTRTQLFDFGIRDIAYGWYRMHIHLPAGAHNLMVGTRNVAGRYEVFANGLRIGGVGNMTGSRTFSQGALRAFAVPDNLIAERGDLLLAIRIAFSPVGDLGRGTSTPLFSNSVFLINPNSAAHESSYFAAHSAGPALLAGCLALVVCLISCALYFALPGNHEYLAISILLLAAGTHAALVVWMSLNVYITAAFIAMYVALAIENFALIEFVRLVLNLRRGRWLLALEIVSSLAFVVNSTPILRTISTYAYFAGYFVPVLAVKIVLPALLVRGWRKGNREALLLFPAIFMGCFADYWNFLRQLTFFAHLTALEPYLGFSVSIGSYSVDLWRLGDFAFDIALLLFLVLRTVRIARERAVAAAELLAARTVQQVLIPEDITVVPGFLIQSVYHPAGQVGGDFFQILPLKDGGVLVVIGDVSGKGMPAAMTVSLLVGTVRTLAHYTENPGDILAAMNQRMLARSNGGFTTCLVLRADTDRKLTIANAGHIPPYLAGMELPVENGLPLGLSAETTYAESTFQISPGQQLTLLTDGVVEARDKSGALYGFERAAALSIQTPEAIAGAAQAFGQDDDITVLTLSYAGIPVSA
jgi:sigma-B regulation protein RsbU (phosphoserine phosphatase)